MRKNYIIAFVTGGFLLLGSLHSCSHESLETEIVNVQKDPILYIKNEYMKGKDMIAGKLIEWDWSYYLWVDTKAKPPCSIFKT